jgi:hypothetical protein
MVQNPALTGNGAMSGGMAGKAPWSAYADKP